MSDILDKIIAVKRDEISAARRRRDLPLRRQRAEDQLLQIRARRRAETTRVTISSHSAR